MSIQEQINALVAESQEIGRQIDVLRERRRVIRQEVVKLQMQQKLARFAHDNPEIVHAMAPGATVEVSATDVLKQMLGAQQ